MERRSGSGGITDVVDQQSHSGDCIGARGFPHDHRQVTMAACRVPPTRFACSSLMPGGDGRLLAYLRVSRSLGHFYYRNTSQPQAKRPIDKESEREDLRRQIARVSGRRGAGRLPGGARPGAVSDDLRQSRGSPIVRWRTSVRCTRCEGDQGRRRRGVRLERKEPDRRAATSGASSGNDALDTIEFKLD